MARRSYGPTRVHETFVGGQKTLCGIPLADKCATERVPSRERARVTCPLCAKIAPLTDAYFARLAGVV